MQYELTFHTTFDKVRNIKEEAREMINGELEKGESSKQRCSCCKRAIPADIERVNFQIGSMFRKTIIRVCANCIVKWAACVDLDNLKIWNEKLLNSYSVKSAREKRKEETERITRKAF